MGRSSLFFQDLQGISVLKIPIRMKSVLFLILAIFAFTCNGCGGGSSGGGNGGNGNGNGNIGRYGMEYLQYLHKKDAPNTIMVYNGFPDWGEIAHVTLTFKGSKKIKELSNTDDVQTTDEYNLQPGEFKWTELESRTLIGIDVTFYNGNIGYCSKRVYAVEAHAYHIYPSPSND